MMIVSRISVVLVLALCLATPAVQAAIPPVALFLWEDGIVDPDHYIQTGDPEQIPPYEIDEGEVVNIWIETVDPDSVPATIWIDAVQVIETDTTSDTVVVPMHDWVEWHDSANGYGSITLSPDYYQSTYGLYAFRIRAIDAEYDTAYLQKVLWVDVINVPQSPVLDPIPSPLQVTEGDTLVIVITYSDADLMPWQYLTLTYDPQPENTGVATIDEGSSLFHFYPYYDQAGVYEVSFRVEDNYSYYDTQTVSIEVLEAGPQPVVLYVPFAPAVTIQVENPLNKSFWAIDPDGETIFFDYLNLPTNAVLIDSGNGTGSLLFDPDVSQQGSVYDITIIASDGSSEDSVDVAVFVQPYVCGDVDGSGEIDIDDVVYLLDYMFLTGPAPDPLIAADVHRTDCPRITIDIDDVTHLISYIFAFGSPPDCSCP